MASAGTLSVSILARTKKFRSSMRQVRKEITNLRRKVFSVGVGLTAVATGGGLGLFIKKQFEAIDMSAKFADVIGLSTKELAGYRLAAKITGVEQSQLNTGFARFQKNIGDAEDGLSTAVRALGKLNLTFRDLKNLSADKQMKLVADRFNNLSNQIDKSSVLLNIFGRSGLALGKLLQEGSKGISRFQREAVSLGVAFSRVDAAKVEAANDAVGLAQTLFTGVAQTIAIKLAPKVLALAELFLLSAMKGEDMGVRVSKAFDSIQSKLVLSVNLMKILQLGFNTLKVTILKITQVGTKLLSFTPVIKLIEKITGKQGLFDSISESFGSATGETFKKMKDLSGEVQSGSFGKKLADFMDKADKKAESMAKKLKSVNFTDPGTSLLASTTGKAASFRQVDLSRVFLGGVGSKKATVEKEQLSVMKNIKTGIDAIAKNTKRNTGAVTV